MKYYTILLLLFILMAGCKKDKTAKHTPACIQMAIDSSLATPKGFYYQSIAEYRYQNKTIYLYVPGCCDRYINAHDEYCNLLFSPSGGISGCGDCQHPNFFNEAVFVRTVWQDTRP